MAVVVGFLLACGGSSGDSRPVTNPAATDAASVGPGGGASPAPTVPASTLPATATPSVSPVTTATVRIYLFQPDPTGGDAHLVPVLRTVPAIEAAAAAVRELLSGPTADERGLLTMIPAGTQLRGITTAGTVATVDLSGAFESGGGSTSMLGRLAQLVYTATQFEGVDTVQLRLDRQLVESIGGEGVIIGAGVRRSDGTSSLPPIFVDQPAWGGELASPGHVAGIANVFEAQFRLQILDGRRLVLADAPVHATCGTGCWGTFDVTVHYSVATAQWGTLRVFDLSAKDGTPTDIREYPVWLTPAG